MAPSLKMASLAAAALLVATQQARGWAPEGEQLVTDMAPAPVPAPVDTAAWSRSVCTDDCYCCSGSNCQSTKCWTYISCDPPTRKCDITPDCSRRC